MTLKEIFVLTAVVVICAENWGTPRCPCSQPKTEMNATIADFDGTFHYVKFYVGKYSPHLDGMAYKIRKHRGNKYHVTLIKITKDKKICLRKHYAHDGPFLDDDNCHISNNYIQGGHFFYSFPFLEKNSSAVYYRCPPFFVRLGVRRAIHVLTTRLDNNLTKALEVARNIILPHEKLIELPFNHKHMLNSYSQRLFYQSDTRRYKKFTKNFNNSTEHKKKGTVKL